MINYYMISSSTELYPGFPWIVVPLVGVGTWNKHLIPIEFIILLKGEGEEGGGGLLGFMGVIPNHSQQNTKRSLGSSFQELSKRRKMAPSN